MFIKIILFHILWRFSVLFINIQHHRLALSEGFVMFNCDWRGFVLNVDAKRKRSNLGITTSRSSFCNEFRNISVEIVSYSTWERKQSYQLNVDVIDLNLRKTSHLIVDIDIELLTKQLYLSFTMNILTVLQQSLSAQVQVIIEVISLSLHISAMFHSWRKHFRL